MADSSTPAPAEQPELRSLSRDDLDPLVALYAAAAHGPGLARYPDEISGAQIEQILSRALRDGVALGAFVNGSLCGEVHAWRPGPRKFAHVLGDLTIAVHPNHQGHGLGRALMTGLVARAAALRPPIERIELFVHDGNARARQLYESLGFVAEGRMPGRIRLDDGRVFDDVPMVKRLPPPGVW